VHLGEGQLDDWFCLKAALSPSTPYRPYVPGSRASGSGWSADDPIADIAQARHSEPMGKAYWDDRQRRATTAMPSSEKPE